MIEPNDLIDKFKKALSEKWGYIINKAGDVWTQTAQNAAEAGYKNGNADLETIAKYGQQWVGKRVSDCSGLFAWAFKQLGGYMYHGSNTMWNSYLTSKGALKSGKREDGKPLQPATAVFKLRNGSDYYHVGLYIGDGKVIEAKGTRYGVVQSNINTWHAWGELKGVKYGSSVSTKTNNVNGGVKPMNYLDAVVTANGGVNMRQTASTSSVRITTIPQGAQIKAAVHDDDWSAVEYNGKNGYVMTKFITYKSDKDNVIDDALSIVANIEKELSKLKALIQA